MICSKIKMKEIEMKKKIILEEAKKIIAKVGFKNAKMKDIAEKVGFSKASLYSYFKDKEEIALNIFKEHLTKILDRTKNLPEQNMNAIEKFNTLRKLHFEFIKGGRNLMIIKPELTEKKEIHQEVFELKFKLFDIAQKIIEQGQEENVFRKDIKPEESMIILDSMMTGIMFQASVVREVGYGPFKHFDVENMIRRALDHFFLAITNTNGVINK